MLPCTAANLYWDTNGATAASGNAGGTWDSATNWTSDATGAAAPVAWTNGQSAIFSAGTDGTATKTVTLAGTVATPFIQLKEVGLVQITGGVIDITGGSVFNTTALGTATGRSLTWTSNITGTGALTLAVNGDTSNTGGGGNTIFALTGTNDFTGNVTITSGVVGYSSNFGNAANGVTLNGGGLVFNTTGAFARNIQTGASGGVLRNYGSATSTLSGTLSGAGELRRTDGGTAILTGSGSGFTGALNLQRGTTQIGDGTQTSNLVANTSGITIGDATGGATLRYQLDSSFALNMPIIIANSGSSFIWQGKDVLDTVTRSTTLGTTAANGTIRVNSGTLAAGSGADFRAANFQVASTPASSATGEIGVLSFLPGSNGVTRFFDIGQGGGCAGKVDQSGGTVTIEAGGSGFRIGHWDNGVTPGSVYNLSGGTLDASITTTNIGWDGQASMTVGGGAGLATLKTAAIQVDANGNSTTYNDTLTLSPNGVAEVAGNVASASTSDRVFLNGGTLRATGNGTWSAPFTLNPATTSTFDLTSGTTTTLSGVVEGTGNLAVTGTGTLLVTSSNLFTGNYSQAVGSTVAGTGFLSAGSASIAGTVSPGTSAAPTGTLSFGDVGTTTAFSGNVLLDLSVDGLGSADLVSVLGSLNLTGATVSPLFPAVPTAGTHAVMFYNGTLTGTPTLNNNVQVRGLSFALDTTSLPGEVDLVVSGSAAPGNLVWGGDGAGNAWNLNSTANWASGQKFFQYDNVAFDDSGNNASNITITGNLIPGSLTIDGTKSYTFSGTGSLIGSASLTKNSTGDLTILNDNKFGTVVLGSGKIIVGNGGSTGSIGDTGSITIADGTTLEFNRSGSLTYARPATAGSSGTLVKKGSGTLNITAAATLLPTNLTVEAGILNVSGGGFSSNRMEGAGQVTVNPGATLVIPAGNAHAFGGDNGTLTETFTINQGTMTLNSEQYFKGLTLNAATVNGSNELRASNASAFLVTGTAPTTIASSVSNVAAANWNVENVTGSAAPDLTITGNITNTAAFNKAGAGTLRASGTNNFTGALSINAGTYEAGSDRALGWGAAIGNASVAGTTVAAGAALDINGVTVNEVVTLNNGGLLTNSNLSTTGTLSGGIAGVRVVDAGSGYTAAPTLGFTGGGGTGATATAAVTSGALSSVTTTAAGTNYTTAPTVTITGAGTLATATATISQLVLTGTGNQIGGAGTLAVNGIMTGSGTYSKVGAGALNIGTGGSTFTGNPTVESGTVNVTGQGNGTTSGLGSVVGTRSIIVNGGSLAFGINNVFGPGGTAAANLPGIVVNQGATLTTNNYNVVGPITLNGGTLTDSRTGAPGGYQAWELKGTVTTGGSSASLITSPNGWGEHLVGTVTFNVADAAAGADLTVATKLLNSSADNASAAAGLTKTGAGTLVLNAANSYTGNTTVSAGTLSGTGSVAGPLTVAATGTIAPGASAGTFGAGATVLAGTYACGIDGANKDTLAVAGNVDLTGSTLAVSVLNAPTQATYPILTYTGTLTGTFATVTGLPSGYSVAYQAGQVVITNAAGDAYSSWTAANGISGAGSNVDSDNDGIPNGIEFVIGGDPSGPGSNSNALLPVITVDATYMTIVFRRTDESATYNPHVQYSTALAPGGWTDAVNGQPGATPVVITTDNDFFGAGIDRVTVKVPRALQGPGAKLFGRLFVNIP